MVKFTFFSLPHLQTASECSELNSLRLMKKVGQQRPGFLNIFFPKMHLLGKNHPSVPA